MLCTILNNGIKIVDKFKYLGHGCRVQKNTSIFVKHWSGQPQITRRNYGNKASGTHLKLDFPGLQLKQNIHMMLKNEQLQN